MAKKGISTPNKSIIRTFGLFWRREYINWNRSTENGELWGYSHHRKSSEWVNFNSQWGIYILYHDYKIVYVGQAGKGAKRTLFARLREHTRDGKNHRWNQFSWFGLKWVNKSSALSGGENIHTNKETILSTIEAILIDGCEPLLNKQGGQWKHAVKYYQHPPDSITIEEKLETILDKQHEIESLVRKVSGAKRKPKAARV